MRSASPRCRPVRLGPLRAVGVRLRDDTRGQDLIELVLTLPILLIVAFGILELGALLDAGHGLSGLTREGANIASRGASLDSTVQVTVANGGSWDLSSRGSVVASRIRVLAGTPLIADQVAGGSLSAPSRLGARGEVAAPLAGIGLRDGSTYYVVEVFLPYRPFTPLRNLLAGVVPDTLYERALF